VLSEIISNLLLLTLKNLKALNERTALFDTGDIDKDYLVSRLSDLNKVSNLTELRKYLKADSDHSIECFRKIFSKVIISEDSIAIKISISSDNSVELDGYALIHETTFAFTKFYRTFTYPIFIYFDGSIK